MYFPICSHRDYTPKKLGSALLPRDHWIWEGGGAVGGELRSQAEHDWRCVTVNASEAYVLLRTMLEVQGADLAMLGPGDEKGWGWRDRLEQLL